MKKLLCFSLLIFLIGCDTSSLDTDLTLGTPELPTGEEETTEERQEIDPEEMPEVELVFKQTNSPFDVIIDLNPSCFDEEYLEENSDFIVIAEALEVDEASRLQVHDWVKGNPYESSEQMSFSNEVSTDPEFNEGEFYKIYFSEVNGKFALTCFFEGVKEVQPYDTD
jgi:hypothetical protein